MIKRYTKNDRRSGVVLIEAALIFPILLLLTFGVIEYGWLFLKMETITNAARSGVRLAVTPDATEAEVKAAVNLMLTRAEIEVNDGDVEVIDMDVEPGEPVTVRINVNYESLVGAPLLFPVPDTIKSEVVMAKEGPPSS